MEKNIKIYSTEWCPYCSDAKDFFERNLLKYENIDVEENHDAFQELIEKSGQRSVPVIDIDGKIVVGFNIEKLNDILKGGKKKEMKTYALECNDGFMIKSHKKGEVASFGKEHIKKEHNKNLSNAEVNKVIKIMK